ncbi:MAG: LysE family translocator [Gorillibacterium sp.]|nr:LysE family translocator [Gorillibacterium sp.]
MSTLPIVAAGFGFGLSIAAPVGPMSLICIKRTLAEGFRHGFVSGLGVATADACYGLLTIVGLQMISDILLTYSMLIRMTGGLFLAYLGVKGLLKNVKKPVHLRETGASGMFRSFFTAYALTLTNPMTILSFLALAASLEATAFVASSLLTAGIFFGSATWWLFLSLFIHRVGQALPASMIKHINSLSCVFLIGFGLSIIGAVIFARIGG